MSDLIRSLIKPIVTEPQVSLLDSFGRSDQLATVIASIVGLQTVGSYSNSALVGDHAGITASASAGTITARAWGSSLGGSQYGTGISPTSYTAGDTDDPEAPGRLYLRITVDGETYDTSAPIRRPLAVNSSPAAITGTTSLGDTLTAADGTWSNNPALSGQWYRNGVPLGGETGPTYQIVLADDDAAITYIETATTSGGSRTQVSNVVSVDDFAAPVNTVVPAITGSVGLGDTLSVSNGTWTADPAITGYAYQWQRGGFDLGGETGNTYEIVAADDNQTITCIVTATNPVGNTAQVSNGVTVADFVEPVISGLPTISGTTEVGQVLTASAASVTGNPSPTRTWQWENNGSPISGATSATYTLQSSDLGDTLTVVQTETNAIDSATAESTATAAITDVGPTVAGALDPQSFTEDTGDQTYDASGGFTGANLAFSLVAPPTGVTINGTTALVTHDTNALALQTATSIVVRAQNSGGSVDSAYSLDITAAGDTTAPIITSPTWNDTTGIGSFSVDEAGTFYLATYTGTAPTADGAGGWTGTTLETFSQAVSSGSNAISFTETAASATATSYAYYVRDAAGNDSAVETQAYTHDITAPVISGVSATAGDTIASIDYSTDTGSGTAYHLTQAVGAAAPSFATLISTGTSVAISSSGAQTTISLTSLTNDSELTTYIGHVDPRGNESTIADVDFTPAAAASMTGPTATGASPVTGTGSGTSWSATVPAGAGGQIAAVIMFGGDSVSSATIDGQTATVLASDTTRGLAIIFAEGVSSGDVTVAVTFSAGRFHMAAHAYRLTGASATATDTASFTGTSGNGDLSLDVAAGGGVIAAAFAGFAASGVTWTGVTQDGLFAPFGGEGEAYRTASTTGTTAATPRTVTAVNGGGIEAIGGCAVSFEAA